jgi:hypothetical protein
MGAPITYVYTPCISRRGCSKSGDPCLAMREIGVSLSRENVRVNCSAILSVEHLGGLADRRLPEFSQFVHEFRFLV